MEIIKRIFVALCVVIFTVGIVACEKEGAAEKAGKEVDTAFDAVKKKAEELSK
nr:hypothetical protein [Desulfobulbaceae bacterium]